MCVCVCELPQTSTPHLNHPQRPLPPLLAPLQLRACRFQTLWTNGVDNATGSGVWGMGLLLRSVLNGDAFFIAFCFACELNAFYWPKARTDGPKTKAPATGGPWLEHAWVFALSTAGRGAGYSARRPRHSVICSLLMDIMAGPIMRSSPRTMEHRK